VTHLDTATFGLPPRRSWVELQQALAHWRAGTAQAIAYDLPLPAARSANAPPGRPSTRAGPASGWSSVASIRIVVVLATAQAFSMSGWFPLVMAS
jgi:hypothetical protein